MCASRTCSGDCRRPLNLYFVPFHFLPGAFRMFAFQYTVTNFFPSTPCTREACRKSWGQLTSVPSLRTLDGSRIGRIFLVVPLGQELACGKVICFDIKIFAGILCESFILAGRRRMGLPASQASSSGDAKIHSNCSGREVGTRAWPPVMSSGRPHWRNNLQDSQGESQERNAGTGLGGGAP